MPPRGCVGVVVWVGNWSEAQAQCPIWVRDRMASRAGLKTLESGLGLWVDRPLGCSGAKIDKASEITDSLARLQVDTSCEWGVQGDIDDCWVTRPDSRDDARSFQPRAEMGDDDDPCMASVVERLAFVKFKILRGPHIRLRWRGMQEYWTLHMNLRAQRSLT